MSPPKPREGRHRKARGANPEKGAPPRELNEPSPAPLGGDIVKLGVQTPRKVHRLENGATPRTVLSRRSQRDLTRVHAHNPVVAVHRRYLLASLGLKG